MNCFKCRMLLALVATAVTALASANTIYSAARLQSVPGYSLADARGVSGGKAVGFATNTFGSYQAPVVWDLATGTAQVIQVPAGFDLAIANGIDGDCIAGSSFSFGNGFERAICWKLVGGVWTPEVLPSGTAFNTVGYAVSGEKVVGGAIDFSNHAAFWSEMDANPGADLVDLTPASGFAIANAICGDMKVGGDGGFAILWDGTNAGTALPTTDGVQTFIFSEALATNGTQHGGYAVTDMGELTAVVWDGATATTLQPAGYVFSFVRGMNSTTQVGFAMTADGTNHAFAWTGNANGVNLHQFLPAGYDHSNAYAIDAAGNIVGTATTTSGEVHAFVWRIPGYTFSNFGQPVSDPGEISAFKQGRVVPLKITVFDSNNNVVGNVAVKLSVEMLGAGGGTVLSDSFETASDSGSFFRYDSVAQQHRYNLGTRNLLAGRQYRITATVDGTTDSHSVVIALR
jgi:probable HAF family extracellular repeat protein